MNICQFEAAIDIVAPRARTHIRQALLDGMDLLEVSGINTPARVKAFLAQMSHESMGFTRLAEMRSVDSANKKYGPETRVGRILGNTEVGDGARFMGRGIIQLTGRWNYEHYGELSGFDLLEYPEQAADPYVAVMIAMIFWDTKGLNRLADNGNFKGITRKINGGYNGQADRERRLALLDKVEL